MLPGPVFNVELLTTARRPRYYALRVLYGLALLGLIWQNYTNTEFASGGMFSRQAMKGFARGTFLAILVLQAIVVITMVPTLCAGVIANEKQRKTLHYLLASRLTSAEIVLGKLMARMLHVVVFLAIAVPIVTMLSLFGGVDPLDGILATLATLTTAFFLASLAVLCSTVAKRVGEAITLTYTIEGAWLFLPSLVWYVFSTYYPDIYAFLRPAIDWVQASSPWAPFRLWLFSGGTTPGRMIETIAWMMGLQIASGIAFLALATWRLRPIFRVQEGSTSTRFLGIPLLGKTRRFRLFGKRPVGDDAMLWKEMHTSRTTGAAQIVGILIGFLVAGLVAYWTWTFGADAIRERFQSSNSYDPIIAGTTNRDNFNAFLRWITASVGVVTILGAAVGAANTLTSEREDDTWTSLIATPLSGPEIVGSKMIGVLWKTRWAFLLIACEWLIGVIAGAIHPMGALFQALELSAFVTFATALGTYFSIHSKSTWKSQSTTIGVLVALGGGYLACCCPVMFQGRFSYLYLVGVMPFHLGMSLVSPWQFQELFVATSPGSFGLMSQSREIAASGVLGTVGYGIGAFVLGASAIGSFPRAADRPRRDEFATMPPPQPTKSIKPS